MFSTFFLGSDNFRAAVSYILSVLASNYNSELEYLTQANSASSQASQDKMFFGHNQFYYNSII